MNVVLSCHFETQIIKPYLMQTGWYAPVAIYMDQARVAEQFLWGELL